jgi:hypothetical protein
VVTLRTHDPSHLGCGFESQLHLKKLDGNYGPLDGRKTNEKNKDSQMGQVTPKKKFFLLRLNGKIFEGFSYRSMP